MRCFLGCDLSPQAKLSLDNWRDKALRVTTPFKPVKPANYHITTWFLGDISNAKLDKTVRFIEQHLESVGVHPFCVTIDNFVTWAKPKIIAATPSNIPNELVQLHDFSKAAAEEANIPSQGNHDKFRPHVTLARKVKPEDVAAPLYLPNADTNITHLHLFESLAGQSGRQYLPRFSFPLTPRLSMREQLQKGLVP